MRIALHVPLKSTPSVRVPNKNFRELRGKPLCYHILDQLVKVKTHFGDQLEVFVDSDDEAILGQITHPFSFYLRDPWFASVEANGHHIFSSFAQGVRGFDVYAQCLATAPNLQAKTIIAALEAFLHTLAEVQQVPPIGGDQDLQPRKYDSLITGTYVTGFYWRGRYPLNYDPYSPKGMLRTQDDQLFKEANNMYVVTKEAAYTTGCRVGLQPMLYTIPEIECLDIDTEHDFKMAEILYI